MAKEKEGDPRPRQASRRWRRRLLVLAVAVVGFELLYVVVGNLVIDSDWLQERINRRPARVSVTWSNGSTFFPGRLYLENVRVVGQSRKTQYAVTFESGRFVVSLWSLFARHVNVRNGQATDLDVRIRRRLDTVQVPEGKAEHFPPINDLTNPPTEKPEELYPKKDRKQPWTITVDRFDVNTLRQVWVNGLRLEGSGEIRAGFHMVVRGDLGIPQARLVTTDAQLSMGRNIIAENVAMTADIRLDSYPYKEIKGKKVLEQLSGSIRMQGDLDNLAFVDDHGGAQAGVLFGGTGGIDADMRFEQGRFMPGSSYSVDARRLDVEFLDFKFTSSGTVKAMTSLEGDQVLGRTEVELGDLTGHRIDHEDQELTATGFTFTSVVTGPALVGQEPIRQIEMELPAVSIPQIAMFNDLLPRVLAVEFRHGDAELNARYAIDASGAASGKLHLQGNELAARANKSDFSGDLTLDAFYHSDDFRAKTYDLAGTSLTVSKVFLTEKQKKKDDEGWWFNVQVMEAFIDITDGTQVDATADFGMRDIKPVVMLLKEEDKAPKWFGMMPNVKDVKGNVELDLDPGEYDIENMDITGKGLKFKGRLDTDHGVKRAAFYAKYKGFAVGIAMDDSNEKKKKHWTMIKPLKWYEEKLAELNAMARDHGDPPSTETAGADKLPDRIDLGAEGEKEASK